MSVEAAVAYFDATLRIVAWHRHGQYDLTAAEAFRAGIHARLDAMPGARGIRQARFVTDFADGRARLPGKSVSRGLCSVASASSTARASTSTRR
ncbi:hypothetical protein [Microbacterium wangchenii]|uniref:hypothetical protein n=1 Tax=Microbacterium wangchenii TaxID=2541726 RepID=UPI0011CA97A6|nr:hypothetical protein [Microbacterium wangchenii]TXK15966.1 hypothetical protein FVP99_10770 [Microbacterium wangchenii]